MDEIGPADLYACHLTTTRELERNCGGEAVFDSDANHDIMWIAV
jgi:hypothetical protein